MNTTQPERRRVPWVTRKERSHQDPSMCRGRRLITMIRCNTLISIQLILIYFQVVHLTYICLSWIVATIFRVPVTSVIVVIPERALMKLTIFSIHQNVRHCWTMWACLHLSLGGRNPVIGRIIPESRTLPHRLHRKFWAFSPATWNGILQRNISQKSGWTDTHFVQPSMCGFYLVERAKR